VDPTIFSKPFLIGDRLFTIEVTIKTVFQEINKVVEETDEQS
jgi:hypothetical protein